MNNSANKIEIIVGDITKLEIEAIVNSANNSLLGGGGVDGAIHKVAGPKLLEECKMLGGCETGKAKITKAYDLPSDFIIHTVGPVWFGGEKNEEYLLQSSYASCLDLAVLYNIKSLAFPSISTGIYGFPIDKAANIAIKTIVDYLDQKPMIEKVIIVCFNAQTFEEYNKAKLQFLAKLNL